MCLQIGRKPILPLQILLLKVPDHLISSFPKEKGFPNGKAFFNHN